MQYGTFNFIYILENALKDTLERLGDGRLLKVEVSGINLQLKVSKAKERSYILTLKMILLYLLYQNE